MVTRYKVAKPVLLFLSLCLAGIYASNSLGENFSTAARQEAFSHHLQAFGKLQTINGLLQETQLHLAEAMSELTITSGNGGKKTVLVFNKPEAVKILDELVIDLDVLEENWKAYIAMSATPANAELLERLDTGFNTWRNQGVLTTVDALRLNNYARARQNLVHQQDQLKALDSDFKSLLQQQTDALHASHQLTIDSAIKAATVSATLNKLQPTENNSGWLIGLVIALAILAIWLVRRSSTTNWNKLTNVIQKLANTELYDSVDLEHSGLSGAVMQSLKTMQNNTVNLNKDLANVRFQNDQIHLVCDDLSIGMMIADQNRIIRYANKQVIEVLKKQEHIIKARAPQFNIDKLLGTSIDIFHGNPQHQAGMLANMTAPISSEFSLGAFSNRIVAKNLTSPKGKPMGYIVEWHDMTSFKMMETEIVDMIDAVRKGDFSRRIPLVDKHGFYKQAGKGMNGVVDIFDAWLKEISRIFSSIAVGDLTQKIEDDGSDAGAFTVLSHHANDAIDGLQRLILQIRTSADTINNASREMASGNIDLSQRTEQQASSLEETAASMEELAATVKTNAENAKQANQMATAASTVATKGGDVVKEVVSTMDAINDSSSKIVDIISVIDGIAFQTNILALNAAVEAARAGEQGRGFAVVAGEVRTLAQKSGAAAKEIKQLISDSVRKVETGSKLVHEAGATMEEIVVSVKRVTDIMDEISAASLEQSGGIDQVNLAVNQMDSVTQQNASLVEESAAAATSLEEQSQNLLEIIEMFKLTAVPASVAASKSLKKPVLANAKIGVKSKLKSPSVVPVTSVDDDWQEF